MIDRPEDQDLEEDLADEQDAPEAPAEDHPNPIPEPEGEAQR
jgi:hypothetical protein